jgi:hypothetical protein
MLVLIGFLLLLCGSAILVFLPALWVRQAHHGYASPRTVICPETRSPVGVTLDATHAALTGLRGKPKFRIADCTRWPEHIRCAQACLPQAALAENDAQRDGRKCEFARKIYHLPVLLAAFAAWYVGMLWHSQFLFRGAWMAALGISTPQLKQLVSWYSPHFLSAAACLLFAYGAAWLRNWFVRLQGIWQGIASSLTLWAALLIATLPSSWVLPRTLLLIELSYALVGAIIVGTIVGGLSGKLIWNVPESK